MSTGVESWGAEAGSKMDAMYPFVGTEVALTVVSVIVWLVWHVWQIKFENNVYDEQVSQVQGNLPKAVSGE